MVKILYLVPGIMEKEEQSRREKIANKFVSPNTVVEVRALESGPISIESAVEEDIAAGEVLKTILRLQDYYDAIVLGCAGDPGLRAARELSKIPIVGPAEASIAFSFLIGDRYGVIVPLTRDVPTFRALIAKYGFEKRLASIVPLNVPVLDLGKDISLIKAKLIKACDKAIEEGAEVVVLGCMSLAFILADELVKESVQVPILNPAKISLRVAEMLAYFSMGHSRLSYPIADYGKLAESVFKGEIRFE
ncbi:MAG: aspartate/glutamate racemase family protein [Nitrososphaeria archaeon]|nr:aspartate/glutamate racemase family protein [Nitrososphaeria archaeon]